MFRTIKNNLAGLMEAKVRIGTVTVILFLITAGLPQSARADGTIAELPETSLTAFLQSFIKTCVDGIGGSNFGKLYCPCAAAFIADRFSIDEVTDPKIMASPKTMDDAHPGTAGLFKVCALAARPSN